VSSNGKMLAVCSYKTIKLFDISELSTKIPELIQSIFNTHTDEILTIGFSSDNVLFASAGSDKALILYYIQSNDNNQN